MPLPRFERLDAETRGSILGIAAAEFAEHGRDAASLATIAERAKLSRSAFYNYFDGKDDVFETVRADLVERLAQILGTWSAQPSPESWWAAFEQAHDRLTEALTAGSMDVALLRVTGPPAELDSWLRDAFADAVTLGLVDTTPGRALVEAATVATIAAADELELSAPGSVDFAGLREVLERVWGRS